VTIAELIGSLASKRKFGFEVEGAVFLTVLHRLTDPGSDRVAEKWKQDFRIETRIEWSKDIEPHQLYRD
jgi:hypothetical protein